jgi:hypothetical protein
MASSSKPEPYSIKMEHFTSLEVKKDIQAQLVKEECVGRT